MFGSPQNDRKADEVAGSVAAGVARVGWGLAQAVYEGGKVEWMVGGVRRGALLGGSGVVLADALVGLPVVPGGLVALAGGGYLGVKGGMTFYRRRAVEHRIHESVSGAFGFEAGTVPIGISWDHELPAVVSIKVPPKSKLTRSDLVDIESLLRQTVFAGRGYTWAFKWDLSTGSCLMRAVKATPSKVVAPSSRAVVSADLSIIEVGSGVDGAVEWVPSKEAHVLVGGQTGRGKSGFVARVLTVWLDRPSEWQVVVLDPKISGVVPVDNHPSVLAFARELDECADAPERVVDALKYRKSLFLEESRNRRKMIRDIGEYRRHVGPMLRIGVAVDELSDVLRKSGDKTDTGKAFDGYRARCLTALDLILKQGRSNGIHSVLATQRPDASILPADLRDQAGFRCSIGHLSRSGSEMIFGDERAAELDANLPPGRAIAETWRGDVEFQTYLVSDEELERYAFGDLSGVDG